MNPPYANPALHAGAPMVSRQKLLDYHGVGSTKNAPAPLRMPDASVVQLSLFPGSGPALPGPHSIKGIPGLKQPGHV